MDHRRALPRPSAGLYLTDSGLETTLVFHGGLDLPCFAAFPLLRDAAGTERLRAYYRRHAALARGLELGFVFESPTWRSNANWGRRLGFGPDQLAALDRRAVELMGELRAEFETGTSPMLVSGCVGPRGDGYVAEAGMGADEAQAYHAPQVQAFAEAGADLASGMTMTNVLEAVGLTRAAQAVGLPVVISFTVETDGRLPSGERIGEAIEAVDQATDCAPAYYMVNCAHPTHFEGELLSDAPWARRIGGLRANASRLSHAELDEARELDAGDPDELGAQYAELLRRLPSLRVLGGCCGTDHRHVARIAEACSGLIQRCP